MCRCGYTYHVEVWLNLPGKTYLVRVRLGSEIACEFLHIFWQSHIRKVSSMEQHVSWRELQTTMSVSPIMSICNITINPLGVWHTKLNYHFSPEMQTNLVWPSGLGVLGSWGLRTVTFCLTLSFSQAKSGSAE